MINHLSLGVSDIERGKRFYDTVLTALGYRRLFDQPAAAAWGTSFPEFWIVRPLDGRPAGAGNGVHVCLTAPDRAAVDAFHRLAISAGAVDDGPPGLRPEYTPNYYASFVRDPDGNKIEAVFFLRGN